MNLGNVSELIAQYKGGKLSKSEIKKILHRMQNEWKKQPLSEGQKGLWAIQKSNKESSAYHIPLCFRVVDLDLSCFTNACHFILEQYPILNAVFTMEGATPYQVDSKHRSLSLTLEDVHSLSEADLIKHIQNRMQMPFDLEKGPLFRVSVFKNSGSESIVLITIHHIIIDGGSVPVLLQMLFEAYETYTNGREPEIKTLESTYADYVEREQALINMNGSAYLAYWEDKLKHPLPRLNLPLDKARSSVKSTTGDIWSQHIDIVQGERLKSFAAKQGVYVWTVILAVFNVLLHRYSGQNDIMVGMPVNQRNEKRFEKLIGFCINMMPVRSKISMGTSFESYLDKLKNDVIDGMACSYPFPLLVRKLNLGYDSALSPLFQTSFVYQDVLDPLLRKEHGFTLMDEIQQQSEYEITLEVMNKLDGMLLNWKYDSSIFEQSTIERMGQHFTNIVESILVDPSAKICEISMLSQQEADLIMNEWNSSEVQYPQDMCIHQLFERKALKRPQDIAVMDSTDHISYKVLNQKADALAAYLSFEGIGTGSLVAVCVERSLNMVVALLGILKTGAAYVPIDPNTPHERVGHILKDSGVKITLVHGKTNHFLDNVLMQCGTALEDIRLVDLDIQGEQIYSTSPESDVYVNNVDIDNPAYVIYTSGTTGAPKGVCVTHRSILNTLYFLEQEYPLGKEDRYLLKTNYTFDVSIAELFGWFVGDGCLVIAPPGAEKSPSKLVDCVIRFGITHINFVPSMLSLFFDAAKENYQQGESRSLKYILVAGEAFPKELADKCVSLFDGARVENVYGPTEASIYATYFSCKNSNSNNTNIPIGRSIANTKLYILDRVTNGLSPIGVPGELCIAGPGLAMGYLNNEELTNKVFIENPLVPGERIYRTGDLARWRSDGVVEYMGRLDFQVKVRGFRIELEEIEYHLAHHDYIKECAVVVRGSGDTAQLVAYYVPVATRMKSTSEDAHTLKKYLASKLPAYMVPDFVLQLEHLPLTSNGKLDRKFLINRTITIRQKPQTSVRENVTQDRVLSIWKDVLNIENLEPTDVFFEAGGNSLLAVTLAERIGTEFNVSFDSTDLFTYPNVNSICKYLSETGSVQVSIEEEAECPLDSYSAHAKGYPQYYKESAAVIGISCHFPGARNYKEFWNNLMDGKNSAVYFDDNVLRKSNIPLDILENPNYVPVNIGLAGKESFDGEFFKLSPSHVALMDPQFRQLLLHAWRVVEDAGYYHKNIPNTGVYVTTANHNYGALSENSFRTKEVTESPEQYLAWVLSQSGSVSSMISYQLGFTGPSLSVHSNCSSSMSALDLAFQALMSGKIDYAIVAAGGISHLDRKGYIYQPGLNFSSDGQIKTFDSNADGMMGGEGVGAILLKRASDAVESNDHIYGILRGVATNSDGGDTPGFYSPSANGQGKVIQKVIEQTKVSPDTITYVEAHGTGTKLGDPVEFKALTDIYRRYTSKNSFCVIGSLKPNIGHLDTAAGLAGCIKVLLALQNKQIPPSINYSAPNPKIDVEQSPFYIVKDTIEWSVDEYPRRAAVSSIGLGGTNGHAIFEEYVDMLSYKNDIESCDNDNGFIVPVSAHKESILSSYVNELYEYVQTLDSGNDQTQSQRLLANIAYTFQTGRAQMKYRVAFVVQNLAQFLEGMQHYLHGNQSSLYVTGLREKNSNHVVVEKHASNMTVRDNVSEIVQAWVSGANIDWTTYYPSAVFKRMSLPTYPFELKSYDWPQQNSDADTDTSLVSSPIHSLLHRNVSTFDQIKYRSFFSGREFFLADHIVDGRMLMPAVAVLEMARAAIMNAMQCEDEMEPHIMFKNISWIRPIYILETGIVLDVELVRVNSGKDDRIKFSIVSVEKNELVQHAEGEAIILPLKREASADVKALLNKATGISIPKDVCYDYIKLAGIDYGDSFKIVDIVHRGIEAGAPFAIGELRLPDALSSTSSQYLLHPSMLDGAIQTSIGLVSDQVVGRVKQQDTSVFQEQDIMIPFSMNSMEIYGSCKEHMYSIVRDGDPSQKSTFSKLLDIDLVDKNGMICVSMRGVGYRKFSDSRIHSRNVTQPQTAKQHTIIPVWKPVCLSEGGKVFSANHTEAELGTTLVFYESDKYYSEIKKKISGECRHILIKPADTIDVLQGMIEAENDVSHIIWFAPAGSDSDSHVRNLIEDQESGTFHLFRLIKACLHLGYGVKKLRWTVVTFSSQKIKTDDQVNPAHAGVHGLISSMAKEYAHWAIALLDVPSDMPVPLDKIVSIPSTNGKTLGLRNNEWFAQELMTVQTQPNYTAGYRECGVYVVIGGAGGIGELWTRYMIEHYRASVVWIGRRPMDQHIRQQLYSISKFADKHNAIAPIYISADACDRSQLTRAYERIREIYPTINGVVHSAIVLADKSLAYMDEECFKSVMSVKVDASVNMVEVFLQERLDFILFFSSIESFVREAGQANYAAGCTFIDSFAQALGSDTDWFKEKPQIKTMNWGYWGNVGVVSDDFYKERMAALGFDSLETDEAMTHLQRFLSGPFSQISLVKTLKDDALELLGDLGNARQLVATIPNVLEDKHIWSNIGGDAAQINALMETLPPQSMQDMTLNLICGILKDLSRSSETGDSKLNLPSLYGMLPKNMHRWLDESKRQLLLRGFAKQDNGGNLVLDESLARSTNVMWHQWESEKQAWLKNKNLTPHVRLVENCLKGLKDVLLGKKKATDIIFPNSSMDALDGIYKGSPVVDYFNLELSRILGDVIESQLIHRPDARFRILEVGAGTGGTTTKVLAALEPFSDSIDEYCYTDISKAFLNHAEDTFLKNYPYLKTRILNIEDNPVDQGFEEGYYDVVISTNALHATSNIRKTMLNIKSVMKSNAVVLLNEMCSNNILAHVTFGLLDGWWLYRDGEVRIPGSPGLTGESWIDILSEIGFINATLPDIKAKCLGQQVIVAASNGIIFDSDFYTRTTTPTDQDVKRDAYADLSPVSRSGVERTATQTSNKNLLIEMTQTYLIRLISEALNVPESELDVDTDLEEYGLDSILVVKINNELANRFNNLDSSLLFEYKCISALTNYLISERFEELQVLMGNSGSLGEGTDSESELRKRCANYLKSIIGKTLKVEIADIDEYRSLFDYGLDSILVVKINNDLSSNFKELESSLVFDHPTISELVNYLISTRKEELANVIGMVSEHVVTNSQFGTKSIESHSRISLDSSISKSVKMASTIQPKIAIVGLNVRMPGAANVDEFWEKIANGINCITPFPVDRWWYDDTPIENKYGGFLEDVGCFDAPFFGISEKDAAMMDPQERVFIETVYGAIEDAGYTPENLADSRKIGVFVGVMNATYNKRASYSSIANRTSYLFDFQGTSLAVDTACSSSLTAIHLAVESILRGENECAIAGGVNLLLNMDHFKLLSDFNMLTPDQTCRPFAENANGFLVSEGVGAVVLRPLEKAIENGDHIYGIIKGSAVNASGRSYKYNVSNMKAQVDVVVEAMKNAEVTPNAISYIETHGTGTSLGDSIEVSALKRAFQTESDGSEHCAIGSVKSNIGHSESASGMAALAKVLMQIKHRKLAPSINCEEINSGIIFSNTPFYVQRELTDWVPPVKKDGNPTLIAGISSFGAGGSNASMIIEEYHPESLYQHREEVTHSRKTVLIPLSAQNIERLEIIIRNLVHYLDKCKYNLEDIAYTLQLGREHLEARILFSVSSVEELVTKLQSVLNNGLTDVVMIKHLDKLAREYAKNETVQESIIAAIKSYDEESISAHWLGGHPVPWDLLYSFARPYRVSLPTYPFKKLFYWETEPKEVCEISEKQSKIDALHISTAPVKHSSKEHLFEAETSLFSAAQMFLANAIEEETSYPMKASSFETSFLDLNLPSKSLIRITQLIRKQIDAQFDSASIFEYSTVNALASYLSETCPDRIQALIKRTDEHHSSEHHTSIDEPGAQKYAYPLSSSQQGIWALQKAFPESSSYNVPMCFRTSQLDRKSLERAHQYTLTQHPILTGVIGEKNGELIMIENSGSAPNILETDLTHMSESEALAYMKRESSQPISLDEGPICRLHIYRTSGNAAFILFNVHHIVFDGQSAIVFMKTLFKSYQTVTDGGVLSTQASVATYSDFVSQEQQLVTSEEGTSRLDYWKRQLHNAPAPIELYTDHPRKDKFLVSKGATLKYSMSAEESRAVIQTAHRLNVYSSTVFMTMLNVLLYVHTQQRDIVVGMPINCRDGQLYENVIGNFVNMIPVRTCINDQDNLDTLCKNLQRTVINGVSNSYPFPLLIRKLGLTADSGSAPLFQIAYMYQDWADTESVGIHSFQYVEGIHQEGEYELVLEVIEPSNPDKNYALNWKYNDELFDEETISCLSSHFLQLLNTFISNPAQPVNAVSVMSTAEADRVLNQWNDTKTDYPREMCVHQLFMRKAKEVPHATALVYDDTHVSYAELDERSNKLASYLQQLGVGPNNLVAVYVDRSVELVVLLLGVLKSGAAYVPLDPEYPDERVAHILSDSGAKIVLTRSSFATKLKRIVGDLDVTTKPLITTIDEEAPQEVSMIHEMQSTTSLATSDDLAYVIYTSGTTGKPKGVMVHHQALTNFLFSMTKEPGLGVDDIMLAVTTHCFDISVLELFLPLIQGATCYICDTATSKNGDSLKALIEKVRPTIMQATPSTWSMLFYCGWRNPEKLKILCGGEAMSTSLKQQICDLGTDAWNLYGPTETTVWSTVSRVSANGPMTIGKPIANTQIYILNDHGKPNPVAVPGELCISGDGVSKGYWNRPELSAEKFIDNSLLSTGRLYKTGDLARWRPDGSIEYLGRIDSQVKLRGYRIELGEIEAQLMNHSAIDQCAVVDKVLGEEKQLVAYFTSRSSNTRDTQVDELELKTYLAKRLPGYMVPAYFVALDKLPQTPNGKLDRKQLRSMSISNRRPTETANGEGYNVSAILAIWENVLGIENIRADEGFFEVGGSSVSAAIVANKISKTFQVSFSVTDMFKYSKVRDIAAYLDNIGNESKVADTLIKDIDHGKAREGQQIKSDTLPDYYKNSVAIIGIACQFPGSDNYTQFWNNLVNGVESVRFYSQDELKEMHMNPDVIKDKRFVPAQSSLEGKYDFDPEFFKISARDAELLDPQLRLLLSNSWKAIEDAGYVPSEISDAAVYMSTCNSQYHADIINNTDKKDSEALVNFLMSQMGTIPTMISYKLGLKGPSMFIHTNCSSSLSGLSVAFNAIQAKQCTHALVGAAAVYAPTGVGYLYEEGLSLSSDGHCKAFDASADGMIGGEGVAVLLLKDAVQAIEDNDHIYAIIRGIGINNDGNDKSGFYAPSVSGQSDVIKQVYKATNINPDTISYVEAHGTGTKLGDPIEISALSDAYREFTSRNQYCAIGSVKSNIGHLDAAAGLAGCIKTALVLRNGYVPASINYQQPNPNIAFETSPFFVATEGRSLQQSDSPLRAALSSFGIGGTNVHAILEAPILQGDRTQQKRGLVEKPSIVPLSALKQDNLKQYVEAMLEFLLSSSGQVSLNSIAYTLQAGRVSLPCRIVFLVRDITELIESLTLYVEGKQDNRRFIGEMSNNGITSIISDEADQALLLNQWIDTGNLTKIAQWWVAGGNIHWSSLYGDQRQPRVSVPTYPFSKEIYYPEKSSMKQVMSPVPSTKDEYSIMTFEECLEASPIQQTNLDEGKTVVCFLHDFGAQQKFTDYISVYASDLNVIYVGKGDIFQKVSDTFYVIDSNDPNAVVHLFDDLYMNRIDVCSVVYMWTVEENRALIDTSYVIGVIQMIARSLLHIPDVVIAGTYVNDIEQASLDCLIGIERSIKQVSTDTTVRVLMSEDTSDLEYWAPIVVTELSSTKRTSALYSDGVRYSSVIRPVSIPNDPGTPIVPGGTYVVAGGTGGIGRKLTEYLVTNYNAQIILIGRSDYDITSAEWIQNLGEKSKLLTYWQVDISDADALSQHYEVYRKNNTSVNGVFHVAGIAEKSIFTEKSFDDINKVLCPKTYGTLSIEKVFGSASLDFICHFSSIASVIGDFGSCDYAIANRFQSSLTRAKQTDTEQSFPVYSINWPILEDGGLGSLARKGKDKHSMEMYLTSSAQKPLDFAKVMNLLFATLQSGCVSPIIVNVQNRRAERVLGDYLSSVDRMITVNPSEGKLADNCDCNAKSEIDIFTTVASVVKDIVSSLLNVPIEKLELTKNFADIGLDSIRLAQFARLLSERFGVSILPSVFFDYTNISELIEYIFERHNTTIALSLLEQESEVSEIVTSCHASERLLPEASQLVRNSESSEKCDENDDAIAIIGMSGLFPEAESVELFWENIVNGRDSVKEIPKSRFDVNAYYSEEATPMTTNCKWMGSIDKVGEFDPLFFEISPREARTMDPRQRHLLQEAWKALEDAEVGKEELACNTVGVFVGAEPGDYHLVTDDITVTSNSDAILASRLSFFLDLSGPVLAINTACSSGLIAVHQACASLRAGECDIAIVAAANFVLSPDSFIALSQMGMLSADGKCHTFDEHANGMVPGEAVTVLVLKRKSKAERDGNSIYSLIVGSGINYDGKTNGITAPSGRAQQALITSVYQKYNIDPADIGHIVTHGTGTRLGDPVEINALIRTFEDVTDKKGYCALTSTKTNIGHTFAASGIVSLISLSESVRHGVIPASLNCQNESDYINWHDSPFYVNHSTKEWSHSGNGTRTGAVSAFGMSGSNAHVVLREYVPKTYVAPDPSPGYLLLLSAKTQEALNARIVSMIELFEREEINQSMLARISDTLGKGRHHFRYRCAIVVTSAREALHIWRGVLSGTPDERVYAGLVERNFTVDSSVVQELEHKFKQVKQLGISQEAYIQLITDLAQRYIEGYTLPWQKHDYQAVAKGISLPPYPFFTKRYWSKQNQEMLVSSETDTHPVGSQSEENHVQKTAIGRQQHKSKGLTGLRNDSGNKGNIVELVSLDHYLCPSRKPAIYVLKPNDIVLAPLPFYAVGSTLKSQKDEKNAKVLKKHDILEDLKSAAAINFKGMVPTLNRTGVMVEHLIPYSSDFVEYAGICGGEVLDIGCAYGVATIAALENGARVFAVDLERKHLDILEQRIDEQFRDRLTLKQGKLPNIDFEDGQFSAIHASRVIHFLSPEEVKITLQKMYRWLKPGGKVFLSTDSPYFGYWQSKAPDYERRKREGDAWPGFIENVADHFDPVDVQGGPSLINALDPDVFERECMVAGFTVEKLGFFGSIGLDRNAQHAPDSGMEHVGIIAQKPFLPNKPRLNRRNSVFSKDGVCINYEVSGNGGMTIVLVHGLGCNSSFWANQIEYFSKKYRIVNIELAGHGDSGSNREKWTIEAYANDVASVVNSLELTNIVLVGHSLGGPVIVEAEYLISGNVIGLIGVETLHNVEPKHLSAEQLEIYVASVFECDVEIKDMFLPNADPSLIKLVESVRNLVGKHILESSYREMVTYMQTVRNRIRIPITLINSSSWLTTNVNAAKHYGINVESIENVGHYSMLEAPERLNKAIENVIAKYKVLVTQ
ncbi:non-ribosomal peptide synthetase [Brevibacillus laterosporus]|uniref:non-ribosomal peptide synthetase n=1 Tax=Brevibacillus laterosporus TaxID=1465 RepID=UPI000EB008E8|nr:non-ribosomal peptide synthetase [Brevibacillus laterosporus]AYK07546.1 amino acid adenylation domain-containing protein [Brevibacillus laterosporus]